MTLRDLTVRRLVREGGRIPRGYGVAWLRWPDGHAVCYPWPFNLLIGQWHTWWMDIRWAQTTSAESARAMLGAYHRGLADGRSSASEQWERQRVDAEIRRRLECYFAKAPNGRDE